MIDQREAGAQAVVILLQAPVSHLVKAEDALQYPERMLNLRSNSGLARVLAPGILIHVVLEPGPAVQPSGSYLPALDTLHRPIPFALRCITSQAESARRPL